jgi:PAS domain S-box-containing protein
MTNSELPRRLWLGLVLIVAPLVVVIALEAHEVLGHAPRLTENRQQVAHAFAVITAAQALDHALQDAESGQRGYLLTGDATYLEPYRTGARDAPAYLEKVKELLRDDPDQQRRMPDVEQALSVKLAEMQHTIDLRDREGLDAALKIVHSDAGLDAMRAISGSIGGIIATESGRLAERLVRQSEEERSVADAALLSASIAFAATLVGIAFAVLAFRRILGAQEARGLSEQRFRLLVEGVPDYAMYMLDQEGKITNWNAGAERLKGYRADEILGEHFSRFWTEEDRQSGAPGRALETALRAGRFEAEGWRVRKDGSKFWASFTITPLRDQEVRHIGFAKITRNVTERREQELALEQTRAELAQSQKMDALGQLSGGIAHDFNNLLHVMVNCTEILERKLHGAHADTRQYLEMVKRNASRAAGLTQRMLAFARRQPLEPKPVNPGKLVAGMEDLLQRALGESIALETILGSGAWLISVDANQLEAAILNLAVNARDAMPDGGKLTIETSNLFLDEAYAAPLADLSVGQYALIAVSDTGCGMTQAVLARAFEPFFTTKEPGKGTGLGLSQVYGFIKQSGGHIRIYSEPCVGTTVRIYLPRLLAGDASETWSDTRAAPSSKGAETIVVVEDDEDVRAFTTEVLRELGYDVLPAPDAHAALMLFEEAKEIELLFTDVGLPDGINGGQLAEEVRRRRPSIKVLFTTGYARDAIVHHGRLDPGVQLITKPFTHAGLARKVRQVLDSAS